MRKKILILIILLISMLLISCNQIRNDDSSLQWGNSEKENEISDLEPETNQETEEKEEVEVSVELEKIEPKEKLVCTHNSNCTSEKMCIESQCQVLEELYLTENCLKKCKVSKVKITTSEGVSYELPPGKGDYSAAGALDWTIVSVPEYCQGEEIVVPIKVLKRNYELVYSDEVVMIKEGEKSKVIKHPLMPSIAFVLEITEVVENCS
jgi:hypothetical protein